MHPIFCTAPSLPSSYLVSGSYGNCIFSSCKGLEKHAHKSCCVFQKKRRSGGDCSFFVLFSFPLLPSLFLTFLHLSSKKELWLCPRLILLPMCDKYVYVYLLDRKTLSNKKFISLVYKFLIWRCGSAWDPPARVGKGSFPPFM